LTFSGVTEKMNGLLNGVSNGLDPIGESELDTVIVGINMDISIYYRFYKNFKLILIFYLQNI